MNDPLTDEQFSHIVRNSALVAIDLIITDPSGCALVGLRNNEPAKGTCFVPGGVIRKGELIREAFDRILKAETGHRASIAAAHFAGVFEHFYPTNRFNNPGYGTHYVVLAYRLPVNRCPEITLDDQHSESKWMSAAEIPAAPDVHENTKAYFR
jgi:colanic acid biosynthesis protein WcaH